jgi:hypothetical protein
MKSRTTLLPGYCLLLAMFSWTACGGGNGSANGGSGGIAGPGLGGNAGGAPPGTGGVTPGVGGIPSGTGGGPGAGGAVTGAGGTTPGAGGSGGPLSGTGGTIPSGTGGLRGTGGVLAGIGGATMGTGGRAGTGGMMMGVGGMMMGIGGRMGTGGMMMGVGGSQMGRGGATTADAGKACHTGGTLQVTNSGMTAYVIDGASNPTLTLCRGTTYVFAVNASGHPFYIKTMKSTGAGNAYGSGVTGNGTDMGDVTFVVPADAPSTLFYACSLHAAMAGTIDIVN